MGFDGTIIQNPTISQEIIHVEKYFAFAHFPK
jgi:hypothetical protein